MKLALQMTCYNGSRYLPHVFEALKKQTDQDWKLYVLDNGSNDRESLEIKRAVEQSGMEIEFHVVQDTLDFANGHNFLFEKHDADFVQLLNDDAFFEPEYLANVRSYMESHAECASASGLVYKWNFERRHENGGRTVLVDTCGFEHLPNGKVVERFEGLDTEMVRQKRTGAIENVFGVSGCLPMYRRQAVIETSPDQKLFDQTFTSYKEDVEAAYRLGRAGHTSVVVHDAVAYHRRSFGQGSHKDQPFYKQLRSYRNHIWIHFMHLSGRDFRKRFFKSYRLSSQRWGIGC